ncbi:MAG: class I SAM-dependent methyltransferase, partial [Gammaproteobacteria bacterium]
MPTGRLELQGRRLQLLSTSLTRRLYDRTAPFYSLSTLLFHTRAHRLALELAGSLEGQTVLEVAIGSGELFCELVSRNQAGLTAGVDLSPGMITVVRKRLNGNGTRNGHRPGRCLLEAVDARKMPFADGMFDSLFNCYLFELLQPADIEGTMREFHRVLRPGGKLLLVNISDRS